MRRSSCPARGTCSRPLILLLLQPGSHPRCPFLSTDLPHPHTASPALLLLTQPQIPNPTPQIPHPSCPGAPGVLLVCHPDIGSLSSSLETSALACGIPQTGNSWKSLQPRQRALSRDFKRSGTKSILLHSTWNCAARPALPTAGISTASERDAAPEGCSRPCGEWRIPPLTFPEFSSGCARLFLFPFPVWLRSLLAPCLELAAPASQQIHK